MSEELTNEQIKKDALEALEESSQFILLTRDGDKVQHFESVDGEIRMIFAHEILYRNQDMIEPALALIELRNEEEGK